MTVPDVFAFAADEEQHRALVPGCLLSVLQRERGQHRECPERNGYPLGPGGRELHLRLLSWLGSPLAVSSFVRPFLLRTPACISCACTLCSVESSVRDQGSFLIVFEFMDLEDELSGEDAGAGPFDETRPRPLAQLFPVCVGEAQRSRRTEVRCSQ